MIALTTTKPNCHLAWRWIGGVERWGKLFYFGPTASASLRLNDPGDSKCQNVPQQHLLPPLCPDSHSNISQRSTNPMFSFSLWTLTTENNPPSYPMRMMLMSVSHILMTQHINWALTEVPLSLSLRKHFFFCPAKFHRGPCQSESAAREGVSPSFSH